MIINVGTGTPTTVLDVAKTLMRIFKKEVPLEISGEYRLGDIRHNYADTTLLKKYLDLTAQIEFAEGMKRFVEWVQTQPLIGNTYVQSLEEMQQKGLLKKSR